MKETIIERAGVPMRCVYSIAYNPDPDEPVNLDELRIFIGKYDVTDLLYDHASELYYWIDSEVIERLPDGEVDESHFSDQEDPRL